METNFVEAIDDCELLPYYVTLSACASRFAAIFQKNKEEEIGFGTVKQVSLGAVLYYTHYCS